MFHVGQHVVYIGKGNHKVCIRLIPNKVYTVRELYTAFDETPCILLEEVVNKTNGRGREIGYMRAYFRPLKKLSIDDFTETKEPVLA